MHSKPPIKNLRWKIAILLCLSTELNYLDRQTLSVLASTIQKDLGLSTIDYSRITFSFLFSYAIMYAIGGWIVDRVGTRRGLLIFASSWSVANMLHALARTAGHLMGFRMLLGATEAANIPAGVKAVAEWFPMRERALAVGIFNAGTAIGGAMAAPLVSFLALAFGWRSAFVVTGALGLFWVLAWFLIYHLPAVHPRISKAEQQLILDGESYEPNAPNAPIVSTWKLLGMRQTWACILARVCTDPIFYFLHFWIPKYLQDERGFNLKEIGMSVWIPYVALTLGNLGMGGIPRYLIGRGVTLNRARKGTMLFASCCVPLLCVGVATIASAKAAVALISMLMFCLALWGNIALPAELFPKRVVARVSGFGGALGGITGAIAQLGIGWVVQTFSFKPLFGIIAFMPLVAFLAVHLLAGEIGRVRKL
jgi:MFS transporter, ACS family, hexuronate transporter